MDTETYLKGERYWENLSPDDRLEILQKYDFWSGFNTYRWEYLPQDLQEKIVRKIA